MYKVTWTPVVGQVLHVQSKYSNTYDRFAVATYLHDVVFGQRYWPLLSLLLLSSSLKDVVSWQSA